LDRPIGATLAQARLLARSADTRDRRLAQQVVEFSARCRRLIVSGSHWRVSFGVNAQFDHQRSQSGKEHPDGIERGR